MNVSGNDAFSIPETLSGNGVSPDAGTPARDDEIDSSFREPPAALTVSGGDLPAMEGMAAAEGLPGDAFTVQEWMEEMLASQQRQEQKLEAAISIQFWLLIGCVLYGLYRFLRIFF